MPYIVVTGDGTPAQIDRWTGKPFEHSNLTAAENVAMRIPGSRVVSSDNAIQYAKRSYVPYETPRRRR